MALINGRLCGARPEICQVAEAVRIAENDGFQHPGAVTGESESRRERDSRIWFSQI